MLTVYSYPPCGTCRKAKKWLDEQGVSYDEKHIVETPPDREELKRLQEKSGLAWRKFFNTSGKKYRELGLKDKLPEADAETILNWLTSDGMLLKRPIVTDGTTVTVGFKENEFEENWGSKK